MNAVYTASLEPGGSTSVFLARMQLDDLVEVMAIENDVYPHPWTRGNFLDALYSGYEVWTARDISGQLLGYFLLMLAVDEAHLLNIAVRREFQGRGIGRLLLDNAAARAREQGLQSILLEVRPSNKRALMVYQRYGFSGIGMRKGYYPSVNNHREDAMVMKLPL